MSWGARLEKGNAPDGRDNSGKAGGAAAGEPYPTPPDLASTFLKVAAAILALALCLGYWAVGRPKPDVAPSVQVYDQAAVMIPERLGPELQGLRFWEPVNIAALTFDGNGDAMTGLKAFASGALNEDAPAWTSEAKSDGATLALAVVPGGEMVPDKGIMVVADPTLKVSSGDAHDIADAMAGAAQPGTDLERVFTAGAQEAIRTIGRPWYAGWMAILPLVGAALAATYLAVVALRVTGTKKTLRNARVQYDAITAEAPTTKQRADHLDANDPHADDMRRRFVRWSKTVDDAGARLDQMAAVGPVSRMTKSFADDTDKLVKDMAPLSGMDIALEAASDFFGRTGNWQEYWDNEVGPVYEDLAALHHLLDAADDDEIPARTREKAEKHIEDARERLRALPGDLDVMRVTPSNALAELDRISEATQSNARTVLKSLLGAGTSSQAASRKAAFAETPWEGLTAYEAYWDFGKDDKADDARGDYVPDGTIRANPLSFAWNEAATEDDATVVQLYEAWVQADSLVDSA